MTRKTHTTQAATIGANNSHKGFVITGAVEQAGRNRQSASPKTKDFRGTQSISQPIAG